MLIVCPDCTTSYEVKPSTLGQTGRSVRCLRCRHVWFAANTGALWAVANAYRTDVGAPAISAEQVGPEAPPAAGIIDAGTVPAVEAAEIFPPAPEMPTDNSPPPLHEPSAITASPPIVPMHPGETALAAAASLRDADVVSAATAAAHRAGRRSARSRWRLPLPGWSTAILALVAVNLALVAWRVDVVRFFPQTASLYAKIGLPVNLRGLVFSNVTIETETNDGVAVLVVAGTIASTAKRAVEIPRLRFAVRDDSGREIYTWTASPPKNALAPGATLAFRSRLASPPREGSEVLVRFSNRRDRVAGIQ